MLRQWEEVPFYSRACHCHFEVQIQTNFYFYKDIVCSVLHGSARCIDNR